MQDIYTVWMYTSKDKGSIVILNSKNQLLKYMIFEIPYNTGNKYDGRLVCLDKMIHTLSLLLPTIEEYSIKVILDSDVIYKWLEKQKAPAPYTERFEQFLCKCADTSYTLDFISQNMSRFNVAKAYLKKTYTNAKKCVTIDELKLI